MLIITLCSCLEELRPLGQGNGEVIIADNSDKNVYDMLMNAMPTGYCREGTLKIVRQNFPCLFSARELAAKTATGKYLFCVDSHTLIGHDSILKLAEFMDRKDDDLTLGFAHAPVNWAHHHEKRARHDRDMTVSELGDWGSAYDHERTITWKGMPWMCRRDWFLDRDKGLNGYGALAEHRVSWGGGDMHIGIKPWLLGFKNWAVPTNACIHIGPFPKIDGHGKETAVSKPSVETERYRLYSESGNYPHTFGFLVSCYVLGGEAMMRRNKQPLHERFGRYINLDQWWNKAIELGRGEKQWLDARKKMSFEELLKVKPWNNGY